jgi:hypothetical protein
MSQAYWHKTVVLLSCLDFANPNRKALRQFADITSALPVVHDEAIRMQTASGCFHVTARSALILAFPRIVSSGMHTTDRMLQPSESQSHVALPLSFALQFLRV